MNIAKIRDKKERDMKLDHVSYACNVDLDKHSLMLSNANAIRE